MSNLVPFSIKAWQAGAKPVCRDGFEPAEIYYFKTASCTHPISYVDATGDVNTVTTDGMYHYQGDECKYDLLLKK